MRKITNNGMKFSIDNEKHKRDECKPSKLSDYRLEIYFDEMKYENDNGK